VRVLLLSTYELGHQPLHLATAAGALRAAGHEVRLADVSVDGLDEAGISWAEAVALSAPMHTAARLATVAAEAIRSVRAELPLCAFGLYAEALRADPRAATLFDLTVAGEYEGPLLGWVEGLDAGTPPGAAHRRELRQRPARPDRQGLPPLDRYARLADGASERLVGFAEATRGCSHRCRHCPVPVIYDGRVRRIPVDTVVADVDRQVEAGATHITFADPDFLNAPQHAMRVVNAFHRRHPEVTFDVTVKVEHVLRHHRLWGPLSDAGLLFVVSAFECVNDAILARLDKGHTAADAATATALLRRHGVEVRPSFMPFTPWTTVVDVLDIVDFVIDQDLVPNVEPIQYSIRLLVPPGSLLLDDPEVLGVLGPFEAPKLTHRWASPDPAVDRLQQRLAAIAEQRSGDAPERVFPAVHAAVAEAAMGSAGRGPAPIRAGATQGRPRLTEPWFC